MKFTKHIPYIALAIISVLGISPPALAAETQRAVSDATPHSAYSANMDNTRLLIEKQCGVTKALLAGAVFSLEDEYGRPVRLTLQEDGTYRPAGAEEVGAESFPVNGNGQAVIFYLPAGKYTVVELAAPIGYAVSAPISTVVGTESPAASGAAETSLSVVDLPLALKIRKVHAKTQQPLKGAAFRLKWADDFTMPITFAFRDGVYWYDVYGGESVIQTDENAEAIIYGLPASQYQLEEAVVPQGFFPAVPQSIGIAMAHTSETPKEVVVVNTPAVKLGMDSARFNVVTAIVLTVLIVGAITLAAVQRRRG